MRKNDYQPAQDLANSLIAYDQNKRTLLGIQNPVMLEVLIEQILESIHRTNYVSALKERKLSERSSDPNDVLFDPLKAAIIHFNKNNFDEAFWLIFLLTHFGRHRKAGWQYVKDVYGQLGS